MDSVSRLVRLARVRGEIDVRCLIAGGFAIDHRPAAPGLVPFHLVLAGSCTVSSADFSVDLEAGDLLLLPQGDAHLVATKSDRCLEYTETAGPSIRVRRTADAEPELDLFCGHYRVDDGAGALLFRLMPRVVHVSLDQPAQALAEILRGEAAYDGPGTEVIVSSLLDALLAMALRSRSGQPPESPALWTAIGDDVLGKAICAVVDRPGEAWTIDRLAVEAAMSRATFLRRFNARTGTTVAALLTGIRMMAAAELLADSDHSVSRVAREVGYRSDSAFGQAFRAALGMLPSQYRKQVRHPEPSPDRSSDGP
ncbi:AraC family transcriptional regulator [Kribbella sp. NPDC051770]|uniref:AraC family transcriptional regulator n=1 Tax=Kribbella sp. NPDC051770 TaxID=3155413 RepID=UPI003434A07A